MPATMPCVVRRDDCPPARPLTLRIHYGPSNRAAFPKRTSPARPAATRPPYYLESETVGDIAVVRFVCRRILNEAAVETIGMQLLSLAEQEGQRRIVLNFSNVDRLASAVLGKLMLLHLRLRARGGWLVFCQIPRHLYEIFTLLRLPQLLPIFTAEQDALQVFQQCIS